MKEHVEAAERQRSGGYDAEAVGTLTFGKAMQTYQNRLDTAEIRPNTKAFREAGLKLVLKSWEGIAALNVRRITCGMVEEWLRAFKASARPHVPPGAVKASKNSTGASVTTIKCALDAVRHLLDIAVEAGHLYANPARNAAIKKLTRDLVKSARREKAERVSLRLPARKEFVAIVKSIREAGVNHCKAAADFVEFIAYCGARKNEAAHVLWSDIDFARETIHLRVTKNGEDRFVPMTMEMQQLLIGIKSRHKNFSQEDRVLSVKEAQGFLNSTCQKAGVPRFTTHALRHLFGTACLEAGIDVRTVAKWLGHKDHGALLLKVYSHVRDQHEAAMIRKVRFSSHSAGRDSNPLGTRGTSKNVNQNKNVETDFEPYRDFFDVQEAIDCCNAQSNPTQSFNRIVEAQSELGEFQFVEALSNNVNRIAG